MFGAERAGRMVEMPGADADEEARGAFYNKLGRTETPDKYAVGDLPQNADTGFVEWARTVFHTRGLTDEQAALSKRPGRNPISYANTGARPMTGISHRQSMVPSQET